MVVYGTEMQDDPLDSVPNSRSHHQENAFSFHHTERGRAESSNQIFPLNNNFEAMQFRSVTFFSELGS